MFHSVLQIILGCFFVFGGSWGYEHHSGVGSLLMLVVGAILITVGGVVLGVKQALRDESKRREHEIKPVLNI